MGQPIIFSQTLVAAVSNGISLSQSPGAGAILLNGSLVANGVATMDVQRRVIITSGGNDSGITFTVTGTNQSGASISETFAGSNGSVAQSNLDFLTVTKVTHTGSVAGTITIGTNGVGSSLWQIINWNATPFSLGYSVELRSGAVNFTVEHTYDDPNNLRAGLSYPLPWTDAVINGASASIETSSTSPITAIRLTTNSGTGTVWFRALQAGLASP